MVYFFMAISNRSNFEVLPNFLGAQTDVVRFSAKS